MELFDKLFLNKSIPPFLRGRGNFVVDDLMGLSLLVATSYKKTKTKYLLIVSNLYNAQNLYNLMSGLIPEQKIALFVTDEFIRADVVAESKELMAQRLSALYAVEKGEADIIIANIAATNRFLVDPKIFSDNILKFKVGEEYNLGEIRKKLVESGYSLVSKIDQSLQFAIRGDILDIFSINHSSPVRLEFYMDELESIRFFDIATQASFSKIKEVEILPANDFILSDLEVEKGIDKIRNRLETDELKFSETLKERLAISTNADIEDFLERNFSPKLYKYYSFITEKHYSVFDYTKDFTKVVFDVPQVLSQNKLLCDESLNYMFDLVEEGNIISGLETMQNFESQINAQKMILTYPLKQSFEDVEFHLRAVPFLASKESDALSIVQTYLNEGYEIVISLSKKEQINACQKVLIDAKIPFEKIYKLALPKKEKIGIALHDIEQGCVLEDEKIVILSSRELFNLKTRTTRYTNKFKEGTILKSYEELEPGDYIVHEYQGIGQFISLETIEIDGIHKDFIKIAYAGTDFLYVPLEQFQLVRKYIGKEGHAPKLSRLHSQEWEKTKKKIKERVNELAERLIALYTERSKVKGFAFSKDDEFQQDFEADFPFELTKDQEQAMNDIKKDMESTSPMDRLICGDVGFGKTELAFRAAFKAINSGKQVAILCPTTLLARQHYERAVERFSRFGIKIALFSRMVAGKKEKENQQAIRDGTIHLAIGTHKLLSKNIVFKNLGLLIVDEEQRFGVEQKERIKELKTNIDVLTLSATPIPRTLQISLIGVRSMSIINTAPENRMPVQTYVVPYKGEIVKELIERELARNGQAFYLHNNISTLFKTANKIQKMLPNASIGVIHGKVEKEVIEETMEKFSNNELDILVCTSIIENGIDIPNVNMIIVENSDHYGLAQLYQIKGRVGRSDRISYAYLMYDGNKILTEKAQKRLQAIKDFTALGSGYKIAQRDLMIRGAGDILGPNQAGFIDSIGLDMYIKLLNEAVKEKMTGDVEQNEIETPINFAIDAYIPDEYASEGDKIDLYQTIKDAKSSEALADIEMQMRDIYGKTPPQVKLLLKKQKIEILKDKAEIESMRISDVTINLTLGKEYLDIKGIGNLLFEALIPFIDFIKISYTQKRFNISMKKRKTWLDDLYDILQSLLEIIESASKMKE